MNDWAALLERTIDERIAAAMPKPVLTAVPDASDGRGCYSPEHAAEYLDIGKTKLYQLIGRGEIEILRIGRLPRVPKSELDAYIARQVRALDV